jgi:hypothetical protein
VKFYVEIIERKTGKTERRIPCRSSADADRVERGALINMSPDFYTRIATEREEGDK